MSRKWNGSSLVDELSSLLGDTSATFKTRVLGWLNDTIFDVATRYDWNNHLVRGQKQLVSGEELQSLEIDAPEACEIELTADGSLESGSAYSVLFTFVQSNGVESIAGEESASVTATDSLKSLALTNVPTSSESLVSARRVYLKKDGAPFYFYAEMDDNFDTTYEINAETISTIEPPDYESVRKLRGQISLEGEGSVLVYKDMDQLKSQAQGEWPVGMPEYFSVIQANKIITYPKPRANLEASFYYYRNPYKLYNEDDSIPDFPISLKPVIKAGVIALGYEYRDRQGQEAKRQIYEQLIVESINRVGEIAEVEYSVRDVYGDLHGYEVG